MIRPLTSLILVLCTLPLMAQAPHALEPVADHYRTLQTLSDAPLEEHGTLDTLVHPAADYGSSLIYVLARPHYLDEPQVEALTKSVAPPANSSEQTRRELAYLLELQAARTPEQEQRVKFLGDIGYWPHIDQAPRHPSHGTNLTHLFFEGREVLGNGFTAAKFPRITTLLKGVMTDMRRMEFTIKYRYLRPRPYLLEPRLEPMARMQSPAFASGHTLWAFLQAYIWSEIVPEKRAEFLALAEEIRRSREIMGIHYPSDNESARQVAHQMLVYYFDNPQFVADLRAAVAEYRAATF